MAAPSQTENMTLLYAAVQLFPLFLRRMPTGVETTERLSFVARNEMGSPSGETQGVQGLAVAAVQAGASESAHGGDFRQPHPVTSGT
jgi:hypothetical protein